MARKIKYRRVPGFRIRNKNPEFDLVESWLSSGFRTPAGMTPTIPDGEVWIDERFWAERKLLVKMHFLEERLHRQGWSAARIRRHLQKKFLRPEKTPYIVKVWSSADARRLLKETVGWSRVPRKVKRALKRNGLRYHLVLGDVVRRTIDSQWIFGGHHKRYKNYISADEIWLDYIQDPREIPYTIIHELYERELMMHGKRYDPAHNAATIVEQKLRQREFDLAPAPLKKIRDLRQSADGLCGPASLKIAFDYAGRSYEEHEIEKLCRKQSGRRTPTKNYGADHMELVGTAKELGAKVEAHADGTLSDIRRNLRKRKPVIVGWMTDDGDHFSVVYHLTADHVYMMDPDAEDGGRRRMPLREFLRRWHDTDGPEDKPVSRWFLAIDFK
jgi:predicted double-glycine peptidase